DRAPALLLERARRGGGQGDRRAGVVGGGAVDAGGQLGGEAGAGGAIGGVIGEGGQPGVERVVGGEAQEVARERRRQRRAEELAQLEQLARVVAPREAGVAGIVREQGGGGAVAGAREAAGGERERRVAGALGADVAGGRERVVGEDLCGGVVGAAARDHRQVPEQGARAGLHGREDEAVAEAAAGVDATGGFGDRGAIGARAVEQQLVALGPDLDVARHRL